ncbi:hypothetical protein SKAU_G00072990 [Synaphobranchus kaupii]|uniref:Uncharacterized protein n=1 Tax=Synaphobranchus kaupii TaxID=118154 RepID=A0A9Q1G898_SYNKA|nr:hypothetical protein SKAU_G00072990 [Synaphobranchus kaupii]
MRQLHAGPVQCCGAVTQSHSGRPCGCLRSADLAVVPHKQLGDSSSAPNTTVEVNVLNSPTILLNLPAELEVQDPAFIQYVAREALGMYKQMARNEDIVA